MIRKNKMRLWYYKRQIISWFGWYPLFYDKDLRDVLRKNRQASNRLGKLLG